KASKQNIVVVLKEFRIYSMAINLHGICNNFADPSMMVSGKLSIIDSRNDSEVDISNIFQCDGLLLCTTKNKTRLVVWNPCTGQTKWINPRNEYYHRYDVMYHKYVFGYENNTSPRKYKIVRVFCGHIFQLEIYEFSSNSWRILDFAPDWSLYSRGMPLKGNTYWLGRNKGPHFVLISFNFTTERFACLCLPSRNDYKTVHLSVVREEQLSVLYQRLDPFQIEVWVTNEIKPNFVSWSKFLTVDVNKFQTTYDLWSLVSFLIDVEKKVVVLYCAKYLREGNCNNSVYIVGEDEYTEEDLGESSSSPRPFMFTYVPSLVQI
ncbi:hypothetical protein EUTSA_v10022393mg, partial [Eutrema salsugineum]